ncbi:nucleosome-remodeling factor subunit BPTF-like isoform X2 [Physella acuta]|uniref:nucleosome-remodeling factor subunit BPTF-like isoform X2 n=1 Tax=Physella acuta TaxID=109671 RepID=UPI0027DE69AE|nr:nucleosome-remodeling factor subunit BPTF-like isoform X2 [Physella acuta]
MSTRGRRSRGRPPKTPVSTNRTNFLRKPKAYQNLEHNFNISSSPSPISHFKSVRSERLRGRAAAHKSRHFVSQLLAEDDEISSLPEFEDRSSDITDLDNTETFDNDADGSDASFDAELEAESSDESLSTISSSISRKRIFLKRPKTPDIQDDKEIPQLELPASSTDLLLPSDNVLQAIGVYEVLRHFRIILRLSPFTFEDFTACLLSEEQSNLLAEIHLTLLKALFREEESSSTTFGPQDLKDSVNISLFFLDPMTWPEIVRAYLDSEKHPEYRAHLSILESPEYPFVPFAEKLKVLQTLTDLFLATAKVREEIVNEGNIHYDDHCRACHKLGDLLCCETCSAVYHLTCVEPPMQEVPEDDWLCSVCRAHQVKGVTDCVSEAEKSGLLCRQEPMGYDRHARKYWFLCRRIIVESEKEVRYYSTKYQLEELLECLSPAWEQDLISFINEMKDDILKQMSYTEDMTLSLKGSRKSILEIENAQLMKVQAERTAKREKEAEEKKKKEEEEKRKKDDSEKKKSKDEDSSDIEDDSANDKSSEEVVESESTVATEEVTNSVSESKVGNTTVTQVIETTTTTVTTIKSTTVTTSSSVNSTDSEEPAPKKSKLSETSDDGEGKNDDKTIIVNSKSSLADAIKSSSDGKPKVISLHSLLPSARQSLLNAVDKSGDDSKSDGSTKTVLLVNRDGGKVTLQVQRQPSSKEDGNSVTHTTTSTTVSAAGLESRKMLTRSKTGSLTPKLFTDSITMTTTSMKATGKSSEDILVLNKDGEISRVNRSKISVTSSLVQQSLYFKLGSEGSYKQYQNQYTINTLALNKHQHNEERDKRRHLSHKFSLTQNSEFKWNGNVMGNKMSTLATLRLTITQLEGNIQAPFLHTNWPNHRQNWQKAVQMCQSPRDFALALSILEACIKPCVMNPVWQESLGHLRLNRITMSDREEWKKKEKEQRRRKEDEDEVRPVIWIKYTMGLKHQVWKQKGEEYRITGGNGWQWISATRNFNKAVPQDSVGLRLVAQKLRNRRIKASKSSGGNLKADESGEEMQLDEQPDNVENKGTEVKEEKMEEDCDEKEKKIVKEKIGEKEKNEVKEKIKEVPEVKEEKPSVESTEVKKRPKGGFSKKDQHGFENYLAFIKGKYIEDKDTAFALEFLKRHPEKVDAELVNVSEALQKRNYYPKITKPYSKLDHLLERRLKQDEFERKQRLTIETQIALKLKLTQAIEIAQKNKNEKDRQEKANREAKLSNGVANETPKAKTNPYTCYSLLCRIEGESKDFCCYSPSCRSEKQKVESEQVSVDSGASKADSNNDSESNDSSNRSSKESTPDNLACEDTMDSQVSKTSVEESTEKDGSEEKEERENAGLNKENEQETMETAEPAVNEAAEPAVNEPAEPAVNETAEPAVNEIAESAVDKAADPAVKQPASVAAETSMEDEEVDIEGDKEGGSTTPSKSTQSGAQASAAKKTSSEAGTSIEANPESTAASVSDIVKNLVIKTMAEKAVASGATKGSLLTAQALSNAVANISLEELKSKLPPKRTTADKIKLAKLSRIGVKKISRISKNGRLPMCHKFETPSKKKSILILDRNELRKMARQGSKRESVLFNYNCKMNNVCWPYPCPRPLFKTAWRFRTMTLQSLAAAALQLRVLWACIKWDDMAAKPPAGGTNTVSTETEITTTELLKRREVGIDGLRSEFLVRKIVVPLGVPDKPKEKYTPQRSGLRERKRIEAVRQTEPSVTEVWVPEEVLELWEIKQFGEKLEKQRQALLDKADKMNISQLTTVTASQSTAQIKAQMEQQLKQQRMALAQKRIQENQGIKIGSPTNITTLAASSTTTIIINNGTQLGKPGTTFKTLTVNSPNSLLSGGVIKTMQPKTIITNAGSLLGTQLRPGIRLQLPASTIQVRPQTVTLAPKIGTTITTTSGVNTITRLISPATVNTRVLSPATQPGTKTQTIQIRPQAAGQPVQNLHFTQTPGGQLQVRGLLPGQIIQRMPDGKLQIITLSSSSANQTSTTTSSPLSSQQTPRPTISIRPQTLLASTPGSATSTPTITPNRLVIPAQLATSSPLSVPAIRQVLATSVAGTPTKTVIINRPGGPQIISTQNIATVLGTQSNTVAGSSAVTAALNSAVVISAPGSVNTPATVISSPLTVVSTVLVNNSQTPTLLSSLTSPQPGQQTIISTLKPITATVASTGQPATSLLAGQIISGTSLLQRTAGGTSLLNISPASMAGGTLTISTPATTSQIPKLLASPSGGTQVIGKTVGSTQPQLIIRPATTAAGQAKVITAQQLRGLGTSPIQLKTATSTMSPIKTILSPQPASIVLPAGSTGKTLTAVRSLTPQLTLQTGQQQIITTTHKLVSTAATSVLSQSLGLTTSPESSGAVTSPTPGTSPGAGSAPKYAITPQVVEQVVRQALLQNQTPEIQQKLLAMQKQIQQQQQSQPISSLSASSNTTPTVRRGSQSNITPGGKSGNTSGGEQSRSKSKGLTQEQKEEQTRIEREEKQEQRNKKKQESAEEKQKRITAINQQKALYKHKEVLKKEILRKRSLMEKNLQQEIYNEMADKVKKTKVSASTVKSPQAGSIATTTTTVPVVAAQSLVSPPTQVPTVKVKKDLKTLIPVTDAKSAQKRKQKLISTGNKGLNPKEKLYCVCKTPYDESKFYIGCDLCSNWFHGACVNISEDRAKFIDSYTCEDCRKQQEHISEELYCLCRTPYDENQFYIGCDRCQDWFHGYCVGISKHEADKIEVYVCPNCQNEEVADPIAQKPLTTAEYQVLQKLLKDLQAHKMAWPFLQPVDPKEVPDYYDIVAEPMDLTIVEAKLFTKAYHKLNDFMKDITKIFDNCRLYNPVDTAYFQCAEVVETYFAQRVKALRSANKL